MKANKASFLLAGLIAGVFAASSVSAADFLADRHVQRGVKCEQCHGTAAPAKGAKVTTEQCSACHGSLDKVAEQTKDVKPNPHYNHLVGLQCNECHRGHAEGVYMCENCHNFKAKVP